MLEVSLRAAARPPVSRAGIILLGVAVFASGTAYLGLEVAVLGLLISLTGFIGLILAPTAVALGVLLFLRALSDGSADQQIALGLNPGAFLGLGIIAIGTVRLAFEPRPRGVLVSALAVVFILVWTTVAYSRFGLDDSIVRETLRTLSILGIGLIAVNHRGALTYTRLTDIVILSSLAPALVAIWQALIGISRIAEPTFRSSGTLAHSNSAAMFFAIVIVLTAWRWAYDSGGRRYFFATLVFLVALLLTKSIGGLGQAVIGLLVLGLLPRRQGNNAAIAFIAIGVVLFFIFDPLGLSRVGEISQTDFSASQGGDINNSLDWRIVNYREYLRVWWEGSPLFGLGFGTTSELVQPFGNLTHSEPLRWLVETGLIGFALLVGASVALVNSLLLRFRRSDGAPIFAAMLGILAGLGAHALVTHVSLQTAPMVVATVVLAGVISIAHEQEGPVSKRPRARQYPELLPPTPSSRGE